MLKFRYLSLTYRLGPFPLRELVVVTCHRHSRDKLVHHTSHHPTSIIWYQWIPRGMDYLRNLGSAAVSTLVQKSGLNLPFLLGSKLPQIEGYFNLYDATKRVMLLFLKKLKLLTTVSTGWWKPCLSFWIRPEHQKCEAICAERRPQVTHHATPWHPQIYGCSWIWLYNIYYDWAG